MKVWIATVDTLLGNEVVETIAQVFATEELAKKYVEKEGGRDGNWVYDAGYSEMEVQE